MWTRDLARGSVVGFGVVVLSVSVLWADPPDVGDPPSQEEIQALVSYRLAQIVTANTAEGIGAAADDTIEAFERYDAALYPDVQFWFAEDAAMLIPTLLADLPDDQLRSLREMNIARAAAGIDHLSILAALDDLIVHDSAAVRYYGWIGYGAIRDQALQDWDAPQQIYETISQRAAAETSGVVVGAICRLMALPINRPRDIPEQAYHESTSRFLAILHDNWLAWAGRAPGDDIAWADALTDGVDALTRLTTIADEAGLEWSKDQVLQDLIDAAGAGGYLYVWATKLGVEGQRAERDVQLIETAAVSLLLTCEAAMNRLAGENNKHIEVPLGGRWPAGSPDAGQRIADPISQAREVRLGVINWANALEDLGFDVQQARVTPPAELKLDAFLQP